MFHQILIFTIFRSWITEMGRTAGTDRRTDVAQCGPSGRPA